MRKAVPIIALLLSAVFISGCVSTEECSSETANALNDLKYAITDMESSELPEELQDDFLEVKNLAVSAENKIESRYCESAMEDITAAHDKILASIGSGLDYVDRIEYEKIDSKVRANIEASIIETLSAEGRSLTMDEIIAYALDESIDRFNESSHK